jgi:RNA polymerase sigma factor (sigma-70 family)
MPREETGCPGRRSRRGGATPVSCSPEQLQALLCRLRGNDEAALQELYAHFTPMIRGAVASYRGDAELQPQLLGQAYVEFHRLVRQFDPARAVNLFTYLERTLPGAILSYVRQQRRAARREVPFSSLPPQGSTDDPTASGPTAETVQQRLREKADEPWQWANAERAILDELTIQRVVDTLSPRRRQVFVLWWKGYKSPEIAVLLGIHADACRQALHRALADVRRALAQDP